MKTQPGYYIVMFLVVLFIVGTLCLILDKPKPVVYIKKKKPTYYDDHNYDVIIEDNS